MKDIQEESQSLNKMTRFILSPEARIEIREALVKYGTPHKAKKHLKYTFPPIQKEFWAMQSEQGKIPAYVPIPLMRKQTVKKEEPKKEKPIKNVHKTYTDSDFTHKLPNDPPRGMRRTNIADKVEETKLEKLNKEQIDGIINQMSEERYQKVRNIYESGIRIINIIANRSRVHPQVVHEILRREKILA